MDFISDLEAAATPSPLSYMKSDGLISALNNLFRRPYFNRVWVIQEVHFARSITIVCGTRTLDWGALQNFRDWTRSAKWIKEVPYVFGAKRRQADKRPKSFARPIIGRLSLQTFRRWASSIKPVRELYYTLRAGHGEFDNLLRWFDRPILDQLLEARHCLSTDPRDKIYALLPLLMDSGHDLDLVPSYTKSPAEVFTECAIRLISRYGSQVLLAVESSPRVAFLPSWVPDWTVPPLCELSTIGRIDRPRKFHRPWEEDEENRGPTLQMSCHYEGRVIKIGCTYVAGGGPFPYHEWESLFCEAFGSQYQGRFPGTFRGERLLTDFVDAEAEREHNENMNQSWNSRVRELADSRADKSMPLSHREIPFADAGYMFVATGKEVVRRALSFCHNRRYFITDTGCAGLGPAELRCGDRMSRFVGTTATFAFPEEEEIQHQKCHHKTVRLIGNCDLRHVSPGADDAREESTELLHSV
ncbi:hypothetical protein IQ06DRAFT_332720 [Phaeosphaeriaceae sp. SRC1lsM3a]|nr:hypothetical protein IQ06DRAFT_332720 [Stagonospora sp. SRC1lsM3a]